MTVTVAIIDLAKLGLKLLQLGKAGESICLALFNACCDLSLLLVDVLTVCCRLQQTKAHKHTFDLLLFSDAVVNLFLELR